MTKLRRIIKLSKTIADELGVKSETINRTALLCKADLTTSLVFEFTELQGFIGADYARISGENEKVVQGIKEHYFPLNAESELAEDIEGQIVGIADKIDTICAVFVSARCGGKNPTGSSDPLGVRRAVLGILKTIIDKNFSLNLCNLIDFTVEQLPRPEVPIILTTEKEAKNEDIKEFFVQRLIIHLSDNYKKDVLEACSKNKNPLENLCDFVKRVTLLSEWIKKSEFISINESANRISRILKEEVNQPIDENLLQLDAEKNLFSKINQIKEDNYEILFNSFNEINPTIEKFFEDVLVMDENEKIKQNRLAMLTMLKKKYDKIADFSTLQM